MALLTLFLIGHLPFLGAPYVNLECWVGEASRLAFEGRIQQAIDTYQTVVSSPPFAFFSIVPFYAALGVSELSARLPSLLAALAVIGLMGLLGREIGRPRAGVLAGALVALNPLFWIYTAMIVCNDLPFTLVSLLLLLTLLRANRDDAPRWHLVAGMLLGLCLVTKFNAAVYPVAIGVVLTARHSRKHGARALGTLARTFTWYLPGILLAALLYGTLWAFTGRIVNTGIASANAGRFREFALLVAPRLAYYVTWIGLFAGPMVVFPLKDLWETLGARRLLRALPWILVLNLVLVGAMNYTINHPHLDLGELRLGWIEHVLPTPVLWMFQLAGLFLGEAVVTCLALWGRRRGEAAAAIALWTLSVLVADSFWRGAQRYLVYLLPGIAIFLADLALRRWKSGVLDAFRVAAVAGVLAMGLALGLFSSAYFATEGEAAADVAKYINENRLAGVEFAYSNSVLCHSAYLVEKSLFAPPGEAPRYETVTYRRNEPTGGALFVRDVRVLGLVWKRYGVRPTPHAVPAG